MRMSGMKFLFYNSKMELIPVSWWNFWTCDVWGGGGVIWTNLIIGEVPAPKRLAINYRDNGHCPNNNTIIKDVVPKAS